MSKDRITQLERQLAAERQARRDAERSLRQAKRYPVINGHATGPYTGRCHKCGSTDLWDDCTAYGCNKCSMVLVHG